MALDFPASPTNGQVYGSYVYNSAVGAWQSKEDPATVATVSTTAPASANPGDLWYDSDDGTSYMYYDDGTSAQWVELLSSGLPLLNTKANVESPVFTGNATSPTFTSTATTGTAPITVSSTTLVANLNADLLDGQHASVYSPAGMVSQFAGSTAPAGWLLCDGSSKLVADYPALYAVIGYTYGGSGLNFTLPDLKGRVAIGAGTVTDQNGTQQTFSLTSKSGELTHTLSVSEMPSHFHSGTTSSDGAHTHTFSGTTSTDGSHYHTSGANSNGFVAHATGGGGYAVGFTNAGSGEMMFYRYTDSGGSHSHTYSGTTSGASTNHTHTVTTDSKGSGAAHNIMQPYIVMNYIIKI